MRPQLLTLLAPALLTFLLASPAWADSQAGMDAYKRGDYATALKELRPLAEQGDAFAQVRLGIMYDRGEGGPENDKEAVRWYRRAAEQGDARAQYNLGLMYSGEFGVPEDYVQSHMWFNLAAAQGNENARNFRNGVAARMTPAQIAEAQRLAREWKPKAE